MRFVIAILAAIASTQTMAADLSASDVRELLAAVGFNPGTSRVIGEFGVQTLTKVAVAKGHRRGEFIIQINIAPVRHDRLRTNAPGGQ